MVHEMPPLGHVSMETNPQPQTNLQESAAGSLDVCGKEVFIPVNALSGPVHANWVSGKVSAGTLGEESVSASEPHAQKKPDFPQEGATCPAHTQKSPDALRKASSTERKAFMLV